MALKIPVYKTDFNKNYNFENVIAWVAFMACDFAMGKGRLGINVNMDVASSSDGSAPLEQLSIGTGEKFDTGQVDADGKPIMVAFPDMAQIISDNQAAFDSIRDYLYTKISGLPKFEGSVKV
jgi:hypothetical protein